MFVIGVEDIEVNVLEEKEGKNEGHDDYVYKNNDILFVVALVVKDIELNLYSYEGILYKER